MSFQSVFLESYDLVSDSQPDAYKEYQGPVVRHIWKNRRDAFCYSVTLNKECVYSLPVIKQEVEIAKKLQRDFEWKIFEFPPAPDLVECLEQTGFRLKRSSRLLYLQLPNRIDDSGTEDMRVVEVRDQEGIEKLNDLANKVWGLGTSTLSERLLREITQLNPQTFIYLIEFEGVPISGGWLRVTGSLGYLYGGMTLLEHRGRGAYRRLVKARYELALSLGLDYLVTEAGESSWPILKRLHFQDAGSVQVYVHENKT